MLNLKKTVFICGRYGSGKTTVALNFAISLCKNGNKVNLADLDIINPCFRASDCEKLLNEHGIKLFAPKPGDIVINDDELLPSTADEMNDTTTYVIADVGDDKEGYEAMQGLLQKIDADSFDVYYVVNFTKSLTNSAEKAAKDIALIEKAMGTSVTGIANTTNAAGKLDDEMLRTSENELNKLAQMLKINKLCTCCDAENKSLIGKDITPITIYERPSWL